MVGYGPLLRRDGPSPAGRNNTLLQVAAGMGLLITEDDGHWQNGIWLHGYPADPASGFDPCGAGTDAVKVTGNPPPLPKFGPVEIYFPETCTAWVVGPPPKLTPAQVAALPDPALQDLYRRIEDARLLNDPGAQNELQAAAEDFWFTRRAVSMLGGTEEAEVELTLCTGGAVPGNPHLTDANLNILNTVASGSGFTIKWNALNPVQALAALEEQIGGTKKGGIIHAPPAIITYWSRYRCIQEPTRQGELYTQSGTPVVVGYGYINAVPDGSNFANLTATQDWAFATGPVKIWREPRIFLYPGTYKEALNRHTNELTYRAERPYVVTWDGSLQAGALIDRSIPA